MKIVTSYTENIKDISDLSMFSYKDYCKKNGISFSREKLENIERQPTWYKIPQILRSFEEGHDVVIWVDADTMLINNDFEINSILDDNLIYISKDFNNFNCGVMIWKKNDITIDILNKLWTMDIYYIDKKTNIKYTWYEQAAFINLYEKNYNNIQKITKIVDQKILNAYDYKHYNHTTDRSGIVSKESFIFHIPGIPNDEKYDAMIKIKNELR